MQNTKGACSRLFGDLRIFECVILIQITEYSMNTDYHVQNNAILEMPIILYINQKLIIIIWISLSIIVVIVILIVLIILEYLR